MSDYPLSDLVGGALRRGARFVEVMGELVPPDDGQTTRWAWIPRLAEVEAGVEPCAAFEQVEDRYVELWCLLPRHHEGGHGWETHPLS